MRLRKQPAELERLREACRISASAHELARAAVRPGMTERQIQALIEQHFLELGARGAAYGSIVAGGDNACVLHYSTTVQSCRTGISCSLTPVAPSATTTTGTSHGHFR